MGKEIIAFQPTCDCWPVALSPDGHRIVGVSEDGTFTVWDAETCKAIRTLEGNKGRTPTSVAFSPDRRRIVSGSEQGPITVWDAETGKEIHAILGHAGGVYSVAFSPDGRRIVSRAWWTGALIIWDTLTGKRLEDDPDAGTWARNQLVSADGPDANHRYRKFHLPHPYQPRLRPLGRRRRPPRRLGTGLV